MDRLRLAPVTVAAAMFLLAAARAMPPQIAPLSDSGRVGLSFEHGPVQKVHAVRVARVSSAHRDSSIRVGDRYLALAGQRLSRPGDWSRIWQGARPGPIAAVRFRDGRCSKIWFDKPTEARFRAMPAHHARVLRLSPIDLRWLEGWQAELPMVRVGVVVPGTRAALAGLRPGDVVRSIAGDASTQFSIDWANEAVVAHAGDAVEFVVGRRTGSERLRLSTVAAHRRLIRTQGLHSATIANVTPFFVQVSILQEHVGQGGTMTPWRTIAPGESLQQTLTMQAGSGRGPTYQLYARTLDSERGLLDWLYRGTVLPEGVEAVLSWPAGDARTGVTTRYVCDRKMPVSQSRPPSDAYQVALMPLLTSRDRPRQHAAVLTMPDIPGFPGLSGTGDSIRQLADALVHARLASESIRRQRGMDAFLQRWQMAPFSCGLEFDESDDPTALGVRVTRTAALPKGQANPIQPDDVIVSFRGRPVFGARCVVGLLREHGVDVANGGIGKPVPFVVRRPGQRNLMHGHTTYYFVKPFWEAAGVRATPTSTAVFSVWDGLWAGFGEDVSGFFYSLQSGLAYDEARWRVLQATQMASQWHHGAAAGGELASLFWSWPRAVARRVAPRAFARGAATGLGRFGFELAENAIWILKDGSCLRTSEQTKAELLWSIPVVAVGAMVPGMFGRRGR